MTTEHRSMGSEGLTATRELVEWVDLIDAPGTTLADLVMRSKAELAAQPAAGEGLDVERLARAIDLHNEKEEPFAAVHCNSGDDCHRRIAQDYAAPQPASESD